MSRRAVVLAFGAVLAGAVLVVLLAPTRVGVGTVSPTGIRLFGDPVDAVRFAYLGRWSREAVVPFRDYGAEYPPLAVAYLGVLERFANSVTEYRAVVATAMALAALAVGALLVRLLERLALPRSRALLLLLPAALYSTVNRYDILVPLLLLPALLALLARRDGMAGFWLALSVSIKFTPLFLLPLFLRARHRDPDAPVRWYRSRLLCVFSGTLLALHLVAFLWVGQDFIRGYLSQLSRDPGLGGLLAALVMPFTHDAQNVLPQTLLQIFRGLALAVPLTSCFAGFPSDRAGWARTVLLLSSVILVTTVLFAPFSSPQWILWLIPILLLTEVRPVRGWIALLVAFDLTTYLQFPVALDLSRDPLALPFYLATCIRTAVLIAILVLLVRAGALRRLLDIQPKRDGAHARS